jgi:hypothetical protein
MILSDPKFISSARAAGGATAEDSMMAAASPEVKTLDISSFFMLSAVLFTWLLFGIVNAEAVANRNDVNKKSFIFVLVSSKVD